MSSAAQHRLTSIDTPTMSIFRYSPAHTAPQHARSRRPGTGGLPVMTALAALLFSTVLTWAASTAAAATADVAAASSFRPTLETLAPLFKETAGHELRITAGSSGVLAALILAGAPLDVFLAADKERPAALEQASLTVPGSRFTYAEGRLVLLAGTMLPDLREGIPQTIARILHKPGGWHLAIANPELAPYGLAARQTLEALGLLHALEGRMAQGSNAGQALHFVVGGGAIAGFVSLSQARRAVSPQRYQLVPDSLHEPIEQQAVLLQRGADNPAAQALLQFLRTDAAAAVLRAEGYRVPRREKQRR